MTMPAGRYYIGDLCYVMHDEWNEVCDLFFSASSFPGQAEGEFTLKDGRRFASFGTAYGDGEYSSNIGTTHGVDSGSIGCIRVEDIRDTTYSDIERLGAIVTFDQPFEVSNDHGLLKFGSVHIETAGSYEIEGYDYE
jgi:hypothetical protein